MNKIQSRLRLITAVLAGAAMLLLSGAGMADPPTRVARLGFFSGPVSFSPAGEEEWVLAIPNRPRITGDQRASNDTTSAPAAASTKRIGPGWKFLNDGSAQPHW